MIEYCVRRLGEWRSFMLRPEIAAVMGLDTRKERVLDCFGETVVVGACGLLGE